MVKCVIWDWNGTLLNDVEANMQVANDMLCRRALPQIPSVEEYRRHFGFPVSDYYKYLGFDLENEDFATVAEEYVAGYQMHSCKNRLFLDVTKTLAELKAAGIRQVIISATEQVRLRREVAGFGIAGYFDEILGAGNNNGESKLSVAKAFVESGGNCEEILFVGDTLHDAEIAKKCACRVAIIPRGHQSADRFPSEILVNSLSELFSIIVK